MYSDDQDDSSKEYPLSGTTMLEFCFRIIGLTFTMCFCGIVVALTIRFIHWIL